MKRKALGGRNKNIYLTPEKKYRVILSKKVGDRRKFFTKQFNDINQARIWRNEQTANLKINKLPEKGATLKEMCEIVLAEVGDNSTANDVDRYLKEAVSFFGGNTPIDSFDDRHIANYKEHLDRKEKGSHGEGVISNTTKNHYLQALGQVLRKAHDMGRVQWIPTIKKYPKGKPRKTTVTMQDFATILGCLPKPPKPHRAIMTWALVSGQRWGDVSRWKFEDIQDTRIYYKIEKTGKSHYTQITPIMMRHLVSLHGQNCLTQKKGYLFANPKTGKPYTSIKKALETACTKAGIQRFTFHHIRHLATNELLRSTKDADLVRRYIGWSNQAMVDHQYGQAGSIEEQAASALDRQIEHAPTTNQEQSVVPNVVPFNTRKRAITETTKVS